MFTVNEVTLLHLVYGLEYTGLSAKKYAPDVFILVTRVLVMADRPWVVRKDFEIPEWLETELRSGYGGDPENCSSTYLVETSRLVIIGWCKVIAKRWNLVIPK